MKKHLLYCLICCFLTTLCQAQQDKSVSKLDISIGGILLDLHSSLKECKLYNFALKIEYKNLNITDISLSDGVDSLFKIEFMKQKDKLDFTEASSYLKANNLQSAMFIKPIFYGFYPWCENAYENVNDLTHSMRFKGIEFTGNNIRLKPLVMILKPAH